MKFTADELEQLHAAFMLTRAEIDAIADAVVAQLKRESVQASLTVAEFAAQARVTPNYVRKLIARGVIEAVQPNGKGDRRITAEEAARYFAGGKHAAR